MIATQDYDISDYDISIAPCLDSGPIAEQARSLITASQMLGTTSWASTIRAWCVPYLFKDMEDIFASDREPIEAINQSLQSLGLFLRSAATSGMSDLGNNGGHDYSVASEDSDVKSITGNHYGHLFKAFSSPSFFDEPVQLLRTRLERNSIDISDLDRKEVLDAGCGGGRYTVAWRLLGARRVVGIDASGIGITDATRRTREASVSGVEFEQGNVLELPFKDDSFDIVFSNGVLHHSEDWKRGIGELVRVLKRGGLGWLYLIENPGGLFWDVIEILRAVMKSEPRDHARAALQIIDIPANRIFYMLDHVMVPINVRLTPEEIEDCLLSSGAKGIRRMSRGTDFDRIEQIYRKDPFAAVKYGVGENRYVFSKA